MGEPTLTTVRTSSEPPPATIETELARGAMLDRYVVLKRVGRGGMGVVYLALDSELERRVAIKVLRAEATSARSAGETRARLLRRRRKGRPLGGLAVAEREAARRDRGPSRSTRNASHAELDARIAAHWLTTVTSAIVATRSKAPHRGARVSNEVELVGTR